MNTRAFTYGLARSAGVTTSMSSRLKFQADMGILPKFMLLWNKVGALTLLPALAYCLFPVSQRAAGSLANAGQAG